jgi:hypothetical protein
MRCLSNRHVHSVRQFYWLRIVPLLRSMAFLLEVAGLGYTAVDGDEALRHMARHRPDLII